MEEVYITSQAVGDGKLTRGGCDVQPAVAALTPGSESALPPRLWEEASEAACSCNPEADTLLLELASPRGSSARAACTAGMACVARQASAVR